MIKKLKLPFSFDSERLKDDLKKFSSEDWTPHFNTSYYEGDWSGIALQAAKDATLELYPDPVAAAGFIKTKFFSRCDYVAEVLDFFPCELETVRFLKLAVGAKIIEHRDYKLGFEDGVARIHIPVQTNPEVEFILDGEKIQMFEGEAWYLNFNLPHSVTNAGAQDRVHLVIDCIINDRFSEYFAQNK